MRGNAAQHRGWNLDRRVLHVAPANGVFKKCLKRFEFDIQARTWFAAAWDQQLRRFRRRCKR